VLSSEKNLANYKEDNMLKNNFEWFFAIFNREFRRTNIEAFEVVMLAAVAHFFGCYNPKQLADYLGVGHQGLYLHLKELSLYTVKRLLAKFMAKQAAEQLRSVLQKSGATRSRSGITLSVDNSVIDRTGRMLRCTWSWYSGRWKKVVNGHDLLGVVMTINGIAFPLCLAFCSKQGRGNTGKPELLVSMLMLLTEEFKSEGIDLTAFPITMDSWFVSEELKKKLHGLGFSKIVIAGKSSYTFKIGGTKQNASAWKKTLCLIRDQWGIDVPALRVEAFSPTFGRTVLLFFQKSATRTFYLMDFSLNPLRGAEMWHIWKQHHIIECFWKTLKSVLGIKSMRLHGDGLYTALLIKVTAYIFAIRLKITEKAYSKMSVEQIMRKIRRDCDLESVLREHFHLHFSTT
jgi:hypothetical protein